MKEKDYKNNVLTIATEERLETGNAAEQEEQMKQILEKYPDAEVILDAENLKYISSAGLRVVLKLRKMKEDLKIINTCPEVYEIFEMTGFSEMITVEKAYKTLSVEGCEVIGKGAKGTVYRYNQDTVVKLYNDPDCLPDIQRERELARKAFILGIPTAISYDIVRVGDSFGSVFELLEADSFTKLIKKDKNNLKHCAEEAANLLRQIHGTKVNTEDFTNIKDAQFKRLSDISEFFTPEENEKLRKMVENIQDTPTMIHGDFHTNNIMSQKGETLLIDMDTLCWGNPVFELMNTYASYKTFSKYIPEDQEAFFGISNELLGEFWEEFFPVYMGTRDEATLKAAEDKIRLLALTRQIKHTKKRAANNPDAGKIIKEATEEARELIRSVDTFNI